MARQVANGDARRAVRRASVRDLARHLRGVAAGAGGAGRALRGADGSLSMTALDWGVLLATLGAIVAYGIWKTRHTRDMAGYVHGGYADKWPTIGLGVMATQASAITFL